MRQYKCVFLVDNRRTEQIVTADSQFNARKLIEAQYTNSKITWLSATPV